MAGECYGLSFDLVLYIASNPLPTRGKEDKLVSRWMKNHPAKENIVWVAERCWIYDHPKAGTVYSHGFLYPSEVATVREENSNGLSPHAIALRGGTDNIDAYSTVTKFGSTYRPAQHLSAAEQVEALVEGSALSRLGTSSYAEVSTVYSSRPSRSERFLLQENGGTVVVHYIKKSEWFVETMVALLGTADEQAVWHRGVGSGLGLLETKKGRVVRGKERVGVHMGKDEGL